MNNRRERQDAISEVFQSLGLGTEAEREHFRRLTDLGNLGNIGQNSETDRREPTDTKNNTARNDDA